MAISVEQGVPIVRQAASYIQGIIPTNNATTPNTKIDLSPGVCADQYNVYDINLGSYNVIALQGNVTTINAANVGLNGIDSGALAASTVYKIYVVADSVSGNTTGAVVSLNIPSVGPLMPFGYNIYRLVGYAVTDASSHFLLMDVAAGITFAGQNNPRLFTFQAPQATNITAGSSTSYADVTTSALLPDAANTIALVNANFVPNAASDTANIIGKGNTGDFTLIIGQVAAVHIAQQLLIPVPQVSATKLQYKVSAGTLAVNIAGFYFNV